MFATSGKPSTGSKSESPLSGVLKARVLVLAAIALVAAAAWLVSEAQRSTATQLFEEAQAADRMLAGMLEQRAALGSSSGGGSQREAQEFLVGLQKFEDGLGDARGFADDASEREAIAAMARTAARWRELVVSNVTADEQGAGEPPPPPPAVRSELDELFERFRAQHAAIVEELAEEREAELARASVLVVVVIVGLGTALGILVLALIERSATRASARRVGEREYRRTQEEFVGTMQVMRDESEAHSLVKHHLERSIPGGSVLVLTRNNSANRLMPSTALEDDSPLAEKLVDAEPESCLAVRLGSQYEEGPDADPLLRCEICGKSATDVVCTPSLVGGEVIGSVLTRGERTLEPVERQRIDESVAQAAPVLANLRNLAIAETRAATDALSGLPNSRACRDNVKRLVAHAGRTLEPLSAVMFDLDHFKQANDRFGHGAGDDVLAAVGEALGATLRASDFGGRYGGEEFLMLLPATDQEGALALAEKLRGLIEQLEFQQPELRVTASFGIATYPVDALDADGLVRMADRALYSAKARGRNRVELVDRGRPPEPDGDGDEPARDGAPTANGDGAVEAASPSSPPRA